AGSSEPRRISGRSSEARILAMSAGSPRRRSLPLVAASQPPILSFRGRSDSAACWSISDPFIQRGPFRCSCADSAPTSEQLRPADQLPSVVDCHEVDDLTQPGVAIAFRFHLFNRDHERFLDDVAGVLVREAMPANRAAHERKEKLSMEVL